MVSWDIGLLNKPLSFAGLSILNFGSDKLSKFAGEESFAGEFAKNAMNAFFSSSPARKLSSPANFEGLSEPKF